MNEPPTPIACRRALGMPANLVTHHVNVLEETGLVLRSRSEGDRRRTYLRLIPEALAALTRPAFAPSSRVVFVCTHTSARSQLAAALEVVRDDDLVIAVCDNVYETLDPRPNLHWSIPDPVPVNTDAAFEAAYADLAGRIDRMAQ